MVRKWSDGFPDVPAVERAAYAAGDGVDALAERLRNEFSHLPNVRGYHVHWRTVAETKPEVLRGSLPRRGILKPACNKTNSRTLPRPSWQRFASILFDRRFFYRCSSSPTVPNFAAP